MVIEISQLKTLGNLGSKDLTDTEFEKYIEFVIISK